MGVDKGTGVRASKRRQPRDSRTVSDVEPITHQEARAVVHATRAQRDTRTVSDVRAESNARARSSRDFPTARPIAPLDPAIARVRESQARQARRDRFRPPSAEGGIGDVIKGVGAMALVPASTAFFLNPNYGEVVGGYLGSARDAKDRLLAGGSLGEQVDAGTDILAATGVIGSGPGKPVPRVDEPAEKVVGALGKAKTLRREQEKLYHQERSSRAAAGDEAMKVGGREGYHAALSELKGELPKLRFDALEHEFDEATLGKLLTHIQGREDLRFYERIRAQEALTKVVEGVVPTRSQIKLLERAFGPDVAAQITGSVPRWAKLKNGAYQVINVPRALRASMDLSAPFRQGLALGARHPRMFAREFKPMLKAFRSEKAYEETLEEIASRPTYGAMTKAKLALTDLENLSTREEGFLSNLAERIPVAGLGVRASGRAYTAFLTKFRADAFDNYLRLADEQGLDITDQKLLKGIASWVNHATGRGSIKGLEGAMVPLNALLFSPRLIASRLQLLNPAYYATLDPFARKQALRGMGQLLGAISMTLFLAKQAGADVGLDPRSSDFGKIRFRDTRIDIAGGFQQYIVNGYRVLKGETVSSTSGETTELEGGFAKPSRADIALRFISGKAAPVPGYIKGWASNENFAGDKFDPLKEAGRSLLPLGLENAYEGFTSEHGGKAAGIASLGLGSIGFGVQTYGAKVPRKVEREHKAQLKEIARMEKAGELTPDLARELRDEENASYRQAQHEAKVGERQTVIEDAIRADLPLNEINLILEEDGHKPVSKTDYDRIEKEVLRLDVEVAR